MSMPSDMTSDVSEAMAQSPAGPRRRIQPAGFERQGVVVAALVAFLGIAYVGPAMARLLRKPTLEDRMARRLQETRRQAGKAGGKVRKRVRRLGGGTIWR